MTTRVEQGLVIVTMSKKAYDALIREAQEVVELSKDIEYGGAQKLADLVDLYIIDSSIPLDPPPAQVYTLKACDPVPLLRNGDTVVIQGKPMTVMED